MTTALALDGLPMTDDEFAAIGETSERIEFFDGSLHVTPNPSLGHQRISRRVANALDAGAEAVGLAVYEAINLTLAPGRIPIPDIAVISDMRPETLFVPGSQVRLVSEILSPSDAATDRVLKMHYYAVAGIPWYLLIDPENRALHLNRLVGEAYIEVSVTKVGDVLRLTEPLAAVLDPEELLPPW